MSPLRSMGARHGAGEDRRIVLAGRPDRSHTDNSVTTARYTLLSFVPSAILEQFRRNGNVYFLVIGILMAIGAYTSHFDSAISPWTTLGPLALVVSISLAQEGATDLARHRSDAKTNSYPCAVLTDAEGVEMAVGAGGIWAAMVAFRGKGAEKDGEGGGRVERLNGGRDVRVYLGAGAGASPDWDQSASARSGLGGLESFSAEEDGDVPSRERGVAFRKVKRRDIRVGDFVVVRNREMIPADLILLASSAEGGTAYVETSSIDGETNLKLRSSPQLPRALSGGEEAPLLREGLEQAVQRMARMSSLGFPGGISATLNVSNPVGEPEDDADPSPRPGMMRRASSALMSLHSPVHAMADRSDPTKNATRYGPRTRFVAALTSEPPNASVNTYSGTLTLPPAEEGTASIDIPLNAENILLRGAVLRNTEWAIGLVCFTGSDTKLVQNSFETPSKFSRLDVLINQAVWLILIIMLAVVLFSGGLAVVSHDANVDDLWYAGFNKDKSAPWPYLPDLDVPEWNTEPLVFGKQVFLFITLLSNFVPLSMYVTVEAVTLFMMYLIYNDLEMYHEETDTRAVARSTIVTDLGQIQYVFSDKTGTLTQNIMVFKRCSVDGMAFGAPIERAAPGGKDGADSTFDDGLPTNAFHPLKRLLVGAVQVPGSQNGGDAAVSTGSPQTFNAEMFLRVMSICHTVVVEKDLDRDPDEEDSRSKTSSPSKNSSAFLGRFNRRRAGTDASAISSRDGDPTSDMVIRVDDDLNLEPNPSTDSERLTKMKSLVKGADGAPMGYAYQAESPDEGALVSAASLTYGYQLLGRTSTGIELAVQSPSLLADETLAKGLKDRSLSPSALAAHTALPKTFDEMPAPSVPRASVKDGETRYETWELLAVNKFDSDRKRMSVLVRSPPELGSVPMLLCKGADSAMLDEKICDGVTNIEHQENDTDMMSARSQEFDWDMSTQLGLEAHLGDFASEGLRTLVLGVRILADEEVDAWLARYKAAAKSIKHRQEKLYECALDIERHLHIVGATAIEDKLQDGVPETIASLEEAGIKLWVLTGDKRETAIEIGYSTKVLTPKMHLTVVSDGDADHIRALMAMEFMRLVKDGKLAEYSRGVLDEGERFGWTSILNFTKALLMVIKSALFIVKKAVCFWRKDEDEGTSIQNRNMHDRRKAVRGLAENIIRDYNISSEAAPTNKAVGDSMPSMSPEGGIEDNQSVTSDSAPAVFTRAASAREMMGLQRSKGKLSQSALRNLSIASVTSQSVTLGEDGLIDEDLLSLASFVPGQDRDRLGSFDKQKRSVLERLFAVDQDVQKGHLMKHLTNDKLLSLSESPARAAAAVGALSSEGNFPPETSKSSAAAEYPQANATRALVIEGAALTHLFGDPLLEELLFSVASCCDAVIACRVSPKQKALLVKLVRNYVKPEPMTLAIGDGANDVGMIQEAHVGIGISGLEGQQAVNASDFAIAQFRFLRELLLIHGRWNFMRMSKVVLFSFYKNAVMVGTMVAFGAKSLYSGTPLYDQWVISMLNFVAGFPILFLGMFDRDLEKDYVKRNPIVYKSGPNNEFLSMRTFLRWACLTVVHVFALFYLSVGPLSLGGSATSAWSGLMNNDDRDWPGNGEGDLKTFGTVIYSALIFTLAYKVLFESRSIVSGVWPACTCRDGVGEGWPNRLAWTWVGFLWLSVGFFFFAIYTYQLVGQNEATPVSMWPFVNAANHTYNMRSLTWLILILVPTAACAFDVFGKVFGNMYYPTQTQIHCEIEAAEIKAAAKAAKIERTSVEYEDQDEEANL